MMQTKLMSTTTDNKKAKILLDLKPAFDGYAGIPQETRLLFRGLSSLDEYSVEGLIQHGARKLRAGIKPRRKWKVSKRIDTISKVIVSVYEKPYRNLFEAALDGIDHYAQRGILRLRTMLGQSVTPSLFATAHFEDFIWRTFFSKTLDATDKKLVTSANFRIMSISRNMMHKVGIASLKYSSNASYVKLDTTGFDYFLAQTPFPGRVAKKTQLLVRYHDAVPVLMPHTINDKAFHQASHFQALKSNVRSGAWFVCVSEATRKDLLKIFPEVEPRSAVIHNIVSTEFFNEASPPELVHQIIRNRLSIIDAFASSTKKLNIEFDVPANDDFQYLLMVSTLEPRKNHLLLLNAWERLKYTTMPKLKLVVVGGVGWDSSSILQAFRPWAERGELFYLNDVHAAELRILYKHAQATVCPSLAEGFDYSGVEAMRSGGIVIASDIPVHREVYGPAAEYFDPYSTEDATVVMQRILSTQGVARREQLRAQAREVGERYLPENILPQWEALLSSIAQTRR